MCSCDICVIKSELNVFSTSKEREIQYNAIKDKGETIGGLKRG